MAELTTAFGRQALRHMQHVAKEVYDFKIIYGDTDSLFVTDVKKENDIMKFIAECSILLDIDVEPSEVYNKFLITKKKHYVGISVDEGKNPVIKGMEGIKSDRPAWINKIERRLADDIKSGKDPTVNIRKEYEAMESAQGPLHELAIKLILAKDPSEYTEHSLQRVVGSELDAHQGDVIQYYKSDVAGGGTSNFNFMSRKKYLEMLKTATEDIIKIMGYDFTTDVLRFRKII